MSRQERLERLQAAERRANRRDFDLRYGNDRRRPYGVVKPSKYQRKHDDNLGVLVVLLALGLGVIIATSL